MTITGVKELVNKATDIFNKQVINESEIPIDRFVTYNFIPIKLEQISKSGIWYKEEQIGEIETMKIGVSSERDELVHYLELKINPLDKDKILREHVRQGLERLQSLLADTKSGQDSAKLYSNLQAASVVDTDPGERQLLVDIGEALEFGIKEIDIRNDSAKRNDRTEH